MKIYTVELEKEDDGRWIADVVDIPGVTVYGATPDEATQHAQALALRVLADQVESGEQRGMLGLSFVAASGGPMKLLDTVVMTVDVPEHDLRVGDIGTIVEVYSPKEFEVEFVDSCGGTRVSAALDTRFIRKARKNDVIAVRQSA